MTDQPQETRCRWCGKHIRFEDGVWLDRHFGFHEDVCTEAPGGDIDHEPLTPAQEPLRIPDDLADTYATICELLAVPGADEPWMALCKKYIERIARLEQGGRA